MKQEHQYTQHQKLATEEYPDINVSIRGAISIARRLQDPPSRTSKNRPKSNRSRDNINTM